MPKTMLYTIVTMEARRAAYEQMSLMESAFGREMTADGIFPHVANAIAAVLGASDNKYWRLWETKKVTNHPDNGTGYSADNKTRYFFEYIDAKDTVVQRNIILEYSRTDTLEMRGSSFTINAHSDLSINEAAASEAITAMLFAIMRYEQFDPDFIALATNFKTNYVDRFARGLPVCYPYVTGVYQALKKVVEPQNEATATGYFSVKSASLNPPAGRMKRVLDGEQIGYVNGDSRKICLAAGIEANLILKSDNDTPVFVEDTPFIIMEPVTIGNQGTDISSIVTPKVYALNPVRSYTPQEEQRLVTVPDWYIPVPAIMKIGRAVADSSRYDRPYRNILLRGPAGTGKTEGAKAMACMFGLPYGHVTGHAEMEFFDLTSSLIPRTESELKTVEEFIEYLTYALVEQQIKVPSFIEMSAMPDASYCEITGKRKDDATEQDCFVALSANLLSIIQKDKNMYTGEQSKFKIIRSDLVVGLEQGWLIELQEMNTIQKPGVLVGLNSILEHGALTLPTGETIHRHKDAVVVFTQNVGYAGTTDANQSVFSRVEVKCDLQHPTEDEMVQRIMQHVPDMPEIDVRKIVTTCEEIRDKCKAECENGSVGTREMINWAKMAVILGSIKEAAELTIIPSCSDDEDDQAKIKTSAINNLPDR